MNIGSITGQLISLRRIRSSCNISDQSEVTGLSAIHPRPVFFLLSFLAILVAVFSVNIDSGSSRVSAVTAVSADVSVDAGVDVNAFNPMMRGVALASWNWVGNWGGITNLDSAKRAALVDATSYIDPGVMRFAGGLWANRVGWDRANTAPTDGAWSFTDPDTGTVYNYTHAYKPSVIDSYADFAAQLGSETVMQVNICDNNPAMWADLLRYTNIEHNYNFKFWELGNEIDLDGCITSAEYAQRFVAYETALKAVDPNILVVGPVPTQPYRFSGEGNNTWLSDLIAQKGDNLDGLFWHWYQMTDIWTTDTTAWAYQTASIPALLSYNRNVGSVTQDGFGAPGEVMPDTNRLNRIFYRRGIAEAMKNVFIDPLRATNPDLITGITEMGPHAWDHQTPINSNQIGAVWLADMMGRWAYNGLDLLTFYTLEENDASQSRALIGIDSNSSLDIRPIYYTEFMYNQYFGDMMVASDTNDPDKQVVAWASRDTSDPSVLKLMVVNLHQEAATANLDIAGFTPAWGESYLMKSADPLSTADPASFKSHTTTINGVTIPDYVVSDPSVFTNAVASITPVNIAASQNFSYELPALSVVAITLHSDGSAPIATATPTTAPAPTATATPTAVPTATATAVPTQITPPPATGTTWPSKIDLAVGESSVYTLANGSTRTLKLLGYNIISTRNLVEATVQVSGGGKTEQHTLQVSFAGTPVVVNGLRIYGYAWKEANSQGYEDVWQQGNFPLTSGKDVGFAVNDASFTLFPQMDRFVYPLTTAFHEGEYLQTFLDPDGWAHSGFDMGVHAGVPILAPHDGYVWYQYYGGQGQVWVTETNNQWSGIGRVFTHINDGSVLVPQGTFVTKGTPIVSSVWAGYDHFHAGASKFRDFGSWNFYQEVWNYQHRNDYAAPRYWLGLGAFSGSLSSNYIAADESGNIAASIQPKVGDVVSGDTWILTDNLVNSVVRVGEVLSAAPFSGNGDRVGTNSVGYLATYVFSEQDHTASGQAHLKLGLSRGAHIWLNGQTVFNGTEARYSTYNTVTESPLVIDKYDIVLPLKKGWNTIIIKSDHGSRSKTAWLVSPKIGNAQGNPLAGVYFSTRDTKLAATASGDGKVQLNWTAPNFHGTHVDSYLLDVSTDQGFATTVISGLNVGNVTGYTVSGLSSGTTYYFRVRPFNATDAGGTAYLRHSDTASATAQGELSIAPSTTSPLALNQTPILVAFGSDDNNPDNSGDSTDNGVSFLASVMQGRSNPDGTPWNMTFCIMGDQSADSAWELALWQDIARDGNELCNHQRGPNVLSTYADWYDTWQATDMVMRNILVTAGMDPDDGRTFSRRGVRTHQDQMSQDAIQAAIDLGYLYHSSHRTGHPDTNGGVAWFPGTMDVSWPGSASWDMSVSSGRNYLPVAGGMVQVPQHFLNGGSYCDTEFIPSTPNAAESDAYANAVIGIIQNSINGNHAPVSLCMHDWKYGPNRPTNRDAVIKIADWIQQQQAAGVPIKVVTNGELMDWIKNPTPTGTTVTTAPTPTTEPVPTPVPTATATTAPGSTPTAVATATAIPAGSENVVYSTSPSRTNAVALNGKTVSGNIYVFTSPEGNTQSVSFYVDDPNRTGSPLRTESVAPFDIAGTFWDNTANPFDTTALSNGTHTITVVITLNGGSQKVVTATFSVNNGGATATSPPSGAGGSSGGGGGGFIPAPAPTPTPAGPQAPGAPSKVTAVVQGQNVIVTVSPPSDNGGSPVTGYRVLTTPDGKVYFIDKLIHGTSITIDGLTPEVDYSFQVRSITAAGMSTSGTLSNIVRIKSVESTPVTSGAPSDAPDIDETVTPTPSVVATPDIDEGNDPTPTPTPVPTSSPTPELTVTPTPVPDVAVISLNNGWNLVSFQVLPADRSVESVFADLDGMLVEIATIINGDAVSYKHGRESNSLTEIKTDHGYWVKMNIAATLIVLGDKVDPRTEIQLSAGWNIIPFLIDEKWPVRLAFSSIAGKYDEVRGFDVEAQSFFPALPSEFNTLVELVPGRGYMIHMTEPAMLVFP